MSLVSGETGRYSLSASVYVYKMWFWTSLVQSPVQNSFTDVYRVTAVNGLHDLY